MATTGFGRYTPGQGFQSVSPGTSTVGGPLGQAINRGGSGGGGGGQSRVSAEELQRSIDNANRLALEKAKAEAENIAKIEAQRQAAAEKVRIENLRRAIVEIGGKKAQALKQELIRRTQNLRNLAAQGYDIVSGGSLTERRILKQQEELNKRIDEFNKQYSGELSESSYEKAMRIEKDLNDKQNKINQEYDTLATSKKSIVYGFFNPSERRLTLANTQAETNRLVSKTEADLRNMKNWLHKFQFV